VLKFGANLFTPIQLTAVASSSSVGPVANATDVLQPSAVIPWLTKIIRSGITFVSRSTHTDGKDKIPEWPDHSCLLLYVSACIH